MCIEKRVGRWLSEDARSNDSTCYKNVCFPLTKKESILLTKAECSVFSTFQERT